SDQQGRLDGIATTTNRIVDTVAPTIPDDKETLWREAQNKMKIGRREDGRRLYIAFLPRFPHDPRAPPAPTAPGPSYAAEGQHTKAAAEFQKVLDSYKNAPEVPEAMWLLGQSFVELKFCSDARVLLQDLERRYPRSNRVKDVRVKLRELQKISHDKRLCTS